MPAKEDLTPATSAALGSMLDRFAHGGRSSLVLLLPWVVRGEDAPWSEVGAWCRSASPGDVDLDIDDGFNIEVEGQRISSVAPDVVLGFDRNWSRFIDLLVGAEQHGDEPYWYCPWTLWTGWPRPRTEVYSFDDGFSVDCYTTTRDMADEWLRRQISAGVQADEAAGWVCVLRPYEPGVVLTGPDALLDEAATLFESVPVQSATTRGIYQLVRSRGWPDIPLEHN